MNKGYFFSTCILLSGCNIFGAAFNEGPFQDKDGNFLLTKQNPAVSRLSSDELRSLEKHIGYKRVAYIMPGFYEMVTSNIVDHVGGVLNKVPGYHQFLASLTDEEFNERMKKIEEGIFEDPVKTNKYIQKFQAAVTRFALKAEGMMRLGSSFTDAYVGAMRDGIQTTFSLLEEHDEEGIIVNYKETILTQLDGLFPHFKHALLRTSEDVEMAAMIEQALQFDIKEQDRLAGTGLKGMYVPVTLSSFGAPTEANIEARKDFDAMVTRISEDRGKVLQKKFALLQKQEKKLKEREEIVKAKEADQAALLSQVAALQARLTELEKRS